MSASIKEVKLDLFVVAYPHEEDDEFNLHLEGRFGDEVIFDEPIDRVEVAETIQEYFKRK